MRTSGRLEGRAAGGVADTIRLRCAEPEAACDEYLEPALNARFRGNWRGRLRRLYVEQGATAACLAIGQKADRQQGKPTFGALWDAIETSDPRLARRLLRPSDLPREIIAARTILRRLGTTSNLRVDIHRADNPLFVPAE